MMQKRLAVLTCQLRKAEQEKETFKVATEKLLQFTEVRYTHYYNSNLIWHTVSHRVDEVIPSDHQRHEASRVIRWYDLIHEA